MSMKCGLVLCVEAVLGKHILVFVEFEALARDSQELVLRANIHVTLLFQSPALITCTRY